MTEPTYCAVVCEELGPPGRLQLRRLPRVPLSPGTVRVALKAAGINFPDLLTIQGLYQHRPQLPFMPGAEAAGIVTEVAAGSGLLAPTLFDHYQSFDPRPAAFFGMKKRWPLIRMCAWLLLSVISIQQPIA